MASTVVTADPNNWDIIDFVINQGNGVKGLSDIGLRELPKIYIQPPEERIIVDDDSHDDQGGKETIPVIDMSEWEDPKVAESICEAGAKWGFFLVVNHGIPLEVLENVKEAASRFFELPAEEKRKYSKEMSPSNSVRFGTSFSPEAEKALEWKDYLSLFYVSAEAASAFWPPVCKGQALDYMKKFESLIKKLLETLMKGLTVSLDKMKGSFLKYSVRINLNYYPICPNPELTVGVGRHSDVSILTILLQDDIGGLYIRGNKDNWIHVPPINGSLVINIGDALQIMSNGRYKSVEHRVAANGTKNRISVPIFVNPKPQDVIGPFPELLASGEKAIYKEVLYSDYVKHFFKKGHDGKKMMDFAKV